MANYYSNKKYDGPEAIVVAMDIGTTHSAVSFAYFCPGSRPQGKMVAHWPGQAHWNGAAKTPTVVSYKNGAAKAYGMDAEQEIEEHDRNVAYWFKLHLHPATMLKVHNAEKFEIPPLPVGVTIERVYADIMRYLMENTQRFFEMTTPNGAEIWERLRDTIVIVLATPNGWDIREQAVLAKAAVRASLVTEENTGHLLQFVTEAEASVHYALANQTGDWLKKNVVFAVIDCGGSTVDTTVYRCVSTDPLSLKEACPSECVQAGGIFVNREVKKLLERKLQGSSFGDPEIIRSMTSAFESDLKPKFDGTMEEYSLKFGSLRDNDPTVGIHKGRITLSDEDLRPVFDLVTKQIIASCFKPLIKQRTKYVVLVGGFAESPYVRSVLWKALAKYDMQIITVGDYAKKAAAEGAIIGHIKQFVVARAAKATFGGCVRERYDKKLHRDRRDSVKVYPDGKERVDGAFHMWIRKGTVLQGTFAHKLSYHLAWDATTTSQKELASKLTTVEIEVFAWEGDDVPIWCKDEHGGALNGMRLICTLNADLSALAGGLQIRTGLRGTKFYRVDYDVCVYFGGTQLRAKLQWKEKGGLRESMVKVMPFIS
ncbi:hypothetical protein M408DRAFT_192451 [Serendipita vermifera MAFF 305830]|uniref:Actin-like ATPase domain-containing protein n=1 Tax=Serendipita vermifera MAFF 305830 TaxID=933852 RepID=A0A0C3B4G3_SERVB|nr:hypothetical protein M408DRAFT_192451 [Serendipita vermifera MAFF 305830]